MAEETRDTRPPFIKFGQALANLFTGPKSQATAFIARRPTEEAIVKEALRCPTVYICLLYTSPSPRD